MASFELLMERALGNHRPYFDLDGYRDSRPVRLGNAAEKQSGAPFAAQHSDRVVPLITRTVEPSFQG